MGRHQNEQVIQIGNGMSPSDTGMEAFFKQADEVEKQMENITIHLRSLQAANEESLTVTKASAMKGIKQRMESEINEVGKIALNVKMALEQIDRDNMKNRQKPGCGKGTGIDRSRMAVTVTLKKKLKYRVSEFQALRQSIQDEYREVVERRVFTVTGIRPDEETIDNLIETGHSEQIFANAIQGQGRGQIVDTLAEIQERADTVKEIEKKLYELQQMFMDLSVLVESQGDLLDDIETQVSKAVDHVDSGMRILKKGKKLQRDTRKYTCIAVIILLLVIIIALSASLKEVMPWSKRT
ncbi:putative syntaxin-131 [Magnolia sinica]|uniref:putative syntaxin-131 n=1 Tax=Magnolia sinica TaxID=86752 RepID=UPI00265B5840|nr:putative syntaxin-131 [Magnolia sinica]